MEQQSANFIDEYIRWIRYNSSQRKIGEYVELTTPFLDMNNDYLQIYIKHDGELISLTDDGYILDNLEMSGCDISTQGRKDAINKLASSLGVQIIDKKITVNTNVKNAAQKIHAMTQAMIKIGDMFLTSSSMVRGLFSEEVEEFFKENDIRFIPSVLLMGASGLTHRFDYVIPASRKYPERLLSAVNIPTKQSVQALLFSFEDIKDTREKSSQSYVILNDTKKSISQELVSAINKCSAYPLLWKDREKYIDRLAG